jgi:hypothetical protein
VSHLDLDHETMAYQISDVNPIEAINASQPEASLRYTLMERGRTIRMNTAINRPTPKTTAVAMATDDKRVRGGMRTLWARVAGLRHSTKWCARRKWHG